MRRRSERSVHSGERAGSVTTSWRSGRLRPARRVAPEPAASRLGCRTRPAAPSTAAAGDAEAAAQVVGERVDGGLDEAGVDAAPAAGRPGAIGSVASRLEVDELLRHADAALAVGDGVVQLLDHRGPAALEALDDDELPQRAGAVEGVVGRSAAARSSSWRMVPGAGSATQRRW